MKKKHSPEFIAFYLLFLSGTYLAASLLARYRGEFLSRKKLTKDEVDVLLAWFAEDVMRTVEREVKSVEEEIRQKYPAAQYIELEPDSSKMTLFHAIDEGQAVKTYKNDEIEALHEMQQYINLKLPLKKFKKNIKGKKKV